MALQTQRYTLVGFSKELDRRSLHFVEPIPANRICKVCSLVPRMTAFLPCLHVVCKTCYEQCQLNDDNFCPLDGNMFREDDVDWRDFPADVLLRRQASADTISLRFVQPGSHGLQSRASASHLPANAMLTLGTARHLQKLIRMLAE
ncbi:uncharacterized protein [Dermacentor albipictus]|uniref:uncharacterized protein isoform X3 n=1 Tax=Dermacentor albipictus TaxID=60249 RepID=UPI0031FCCE56